jgi:hypothetical protein
MSYGCPSVLDDLWHSLITSLPLPAVLLSVFAGDYKDPQDAYEKVLHIRIVIHDDGGLPYERKVPVHSTDPQALCRPLIQRPCPARLTRRRSFRVEVLSCN